jgi:hypothetical protein
MLQCNRKRRKNSDRRSDSAKVLSGFLTPPILFFFERSIHRIDELLVFHKLVLR